VENNRELELTRFLRSSGIEMTSEEVEQAVQFVRRADEASDAMRRAARAFPIKRDLATLKARWEAKDPNIQAIDHGDGRITYERRFTDAQIEILQKAYVANRPRVQDYYLLGWSHEATVFVRIIESWAASIELLQAITPPNQKTRIRSLNSVANALAKLDQALGTLDSGALGHLYAKVAEAMMEAGSLPSEAANRSGSLRQSPALVVAEAGEGRKVLRTVIAALVNATKSAAGDLPTFDHVENDPKLGVVRQLERLMREHQLPFEASETGFAAQCVRAMFDLADVNVEKVGYWIKKAIDHPDSDARWLKSLGDRAEQIVA
jgi:hypothetical protein